MLTTALLFALSIVQANDETSAAETDPYYVEDPFAIEPEREPAQVAEPAVSAEAPPAPSRERLICRTRPELNTRTRRLRVCLTAAEWQHHQTNMEQQRRDINDWGAQGGLGPE